MNRQDTVTGLILAGGAGTRVQGQDKGLLQRNGSALVEHVVRRLAPQVDELLLSCNRNEAVYRQYVRRTVGDCRSDYQGPLAGIEAAAQSVQTSFLAVVPCDTPELPTDLVQRLLQPLLKGTAQISHAHDGIRAQYLCAVIQHAALNTLPGYLDSGQRAVRHWFAMHDAVSVDFSDQATAFANYNTL